LPASTTHPRPYGRHGNRRSTEERAASAKARSAGERGPPRRHDRRALSHQRGRACLQRPPFSRLCASKSGEEENGSRVFTGTRFCPGPDGCFPSDRIERRRMTKITNWATGANWTHFISGLRTYVQLAQWKVFPFLIYLLLGQKGMGYRGYFRLNRFWPFLSFSALYDL
jgi:hypothetical protein